MKLRPCEHHAIVRSGSAGRCLECGTTMVWPLRVKLHRGT
jgi:ribosomal protein S27E